ncbi:MAG: putative glycoside hydrolase [Treponema sp.]|nr:putative glycoside hydrolase [Treponema sp.]
MTISKAPAEARTGAGGTGGRTESNAAEAGWPLLVGTGKGLAGLDWSGKSAFLWQGGSVRKILRFYSDAGGQAPAWAILSSEGILVSRNLLTWEYRNRGLPVKSVKIFEDGKKSFLPVVQDIKDLEINPANPDIMVCATKDRVYLSRDQGRSWSSLGMPPYRTNGVKAVAAAYMPRSPDETPRAGTAGPFPAEGVLTVFLSHSTYGVHYLQPDLPGVRWTELNAGLETLETTGNADEVSDIAVVLRPAVSGSVGPASVAPEIYVSQTFRRRIYRLDWDGKIFSPLWSDDAPFGTVDSLDAGRTSLRFIREGAVAEIDYDYPAAAGLGAKRRQEAPRDAAAGQRTRPDILEFIRGIPKNLDIEPNCIVMRENRNRRDAEVISLSELWLLSENAAPGSAGSPAAARTGAGGAARPAAAQSAGREGLYLPVNRALESDSLEAYLDIIDRRGLDMVVIDMKDDYGRLRFTPDNSEIAKKGRAFRPLDIDSFLRGMKARGVYTIARVVVFKDPALALREGGKYAVWDSRNNKPWAGYYEIRRKKSEVPPGEERREDLTEILPDPDSEYEILRTYYDERWVDPYSEEVWEYTAQIATELYERGFDEIQFDYIRFPTDGQNLADVRYRWQEGGMDMESAMLSFLRHIRLRVRAPISIDIYGANGWYRTGARTGQEVELLAPWVDVICPMYYPSHFEQNFLAQAPAEMRPYRIYYQGTQRTARIGRGQVIVRPYVQAFYLNVSYDRKYYNADYVRRQAEGVRDAGSPGFTYWNNSGRYEDIPFPLDFEQRRSGVRID